MKKRILMALIAAIAVAGAANAQVTISGGFAISGAEISYADTSSEIGLGGNLYIDYILPVGIPLSLGAEVGYDTAGFKASGTSVGTGVAIPLLGRVAYHFDLMSNLDLYLVGKGGYVIIDFKPESSITSGYKFTPAGGFAFGFDVGAAFYFTQLVGVFAEAGFEQYKGTVEITEDYSGYSSTFDVTFSRYATIGLSIKL